MTHRPHSVVCQQMLERAQEIAAHDPVSETAILLAHGAAAIAEQGAHITQLLAQGARDTSHIQRARAELWQLRNLLECPVIRALADAQAHHRQHGQMPDIPDPIIRRLAELVAAAASRTEATTRETAPHE